MGDCIILAGGFGSRLRGVVSDRPKCLAPVNGKPFLYWLMLNLKRGGINKFFLSLGFEADKVIKEILDWENEFDVSWVVEGKPLGTGGALLFCMKNFLLSESLIVNGDTYLDCNLDSLMKPLNLFNGELIRMGTVLVSDRARFGGVEVDHQWRVTSFTEKGKKLPGMINAGIYRVNIEAFLEESEETFSFENSTLPKLVSMHKVFVELLSGSFIDIGIPDDYKLFSESYGNLSGK